MRWVCALLAAVAAALMAVAMAVGIIEGPFPGWLIVGPLPFYVIGLIAFWRRPDHPSIHWLVICGATFAIESSLGCLLPWLAETLPAGWLALVAMLRQWAAMGSSFGALGLIVTFPTGRTETRLERLVLGIAGLEMALVPALNALASATLAPGQFSDPLEPAVASPVAIAVLTPLGPVTASLYELYPLWVVVGVGLLALRYLNAPPRRRLRIRWMLIGWTASIFTWVPLMLFAAPTNPSPVQLALFALMWPLTEALVLGAVLVALFQDGVFGIDQPARRRAARRVIRVAIAVTGVFVAAGLGLLVGNAAGTPAAVLTAVLLMVVGRPAWQGTERAADRWLFGARLDGYDMLTRFGSSLESTPTPDGLADALARTLHVGLDLTWVTVTLSPPISAQATRGTAGGDVITVPLSHAGETVGSISVGQRRDGPLLDEDERLLAILAAQACAAAGALRLSAELAERIEVIRSQALELAASRDRVVTGQDMERRRIQRDLHDGIQQELVALSAKLSVAQQRLARGDPTAAEALTELQRDVRALVGEVREFAYAIHPPVLTDRGLVEAVEGQAARSAVPTQVTVDPDLRTITLPETVESAAWYAISEAMSNVVKHAEASTSEVGLRQDRGLLLISVQDDGCGFDAHVPRGLGLTGLADRLDTVGGSIDVSSTPGAGTRLSMQIPIRSGS